MIFLNIVPLVPCYSPLTINDVADINDINDISTEYSKLYHKRVTLKRRSAPHWVDCQGEVIQPIVIIKVNSLLTTQPFYQDQLVILPIFLELHKVLIDNHKFLHL